VALAAAMQYLTPLDPIWHIHASPESIEKADDGNILHATPGVKLSLIPFDWLRAGASNKKSKKVKGHIRRDHDVSRTEVDNEVN
jgi:hypothetical protein